MLCDFKIILLIIEFETALATSHPSNEFVPAGCRDSVVPHLEEEESQVYLSPIIDGRFL